MTLITLALFTACLLALAENGQLQLPGLLAYRGTGRMNVPNLFCYRGTGRLGCYRASERG